MPLPTPCQIVDLRQEFLRQNFSIFSWSLEEAIRQQLAQKRQILLFLNRRGTSTSVICRQCGHTMRCTACDLALTYHQQEFTTMWRSNLLCHACGRLYPTPQTCPNCRSAFIKFVGIGTQKVETECRKLFPGSRVARLDSDSLRTKDAFQKIYADFAAQQLDILVGTQLITKGWDLPNIGLVGVILADLSLNVPDFRAPERAFALFTQLAGRTGRGGSSGQVIIQTYNPEHAVFKHLVGGTYDSFYQEEITQRQAFGYPPFGQIIKLEHVDTDSRRQNTAVTTLFEALEQKNQSAATPHRLYRVTPPAAKINNQWHQQIIIRGPAPTTLLPAELGTGWRIDVDPSHIA